MKRAALHILLALAWADAWLRRHLPAAVAGISAAEALAAVTGIVGALCMATMGNPALAFVLFLISNLAWIAFARSRRHWGLLAQQGLFLLTSVLGLWNWWLAPHLLSG